MPRLNLLRPHRRNVSSHPTPDPPPGPRPNTLPTPPLPPASAPPQSTRLDALPPLDIGSSDLGSPGQWLSLEFRHEPNPSQSQSTIATTAPSMSQASRTSTPYTVVTSELSPTPVPYVPRPGSRPKTAVATTPSAATGRFSPGPPSMPPPPPPSQAATAEREKMHSREPSYSRRKEKLNLLNPMALLRRRSSQASIQLEKERLRRELPDDFDPGIIYGTRHPDWSSPSKRRDNDGTAATLGTLSPPINGRSPSPIPPVPSVPQVTDGSSVADATPDGKMLKVLEVASPGISEFELQRTPRSVFKEDFEDDNQKVKQPDQLTTYSPPSPAPPPRPVSPPANSPPPPPPPPPPVQEEKIDVVTKNASVKAPEVLLEPKIPTIAPGKSEASDSENSDAGEYRRGVTLVDHPLSLPHHMLSNASRFSFEASSTGPSATGSCAASHRGDDLSEADVEEDSFQFDLAEDGDDEDGFGRANEELLGFEDGLPALQEAVRALELSKQQQQQGIGLAVSTDDGKVEMANGMEEIGGGQNMGLGLTGVASSADLPTMEPVPVQTGDPTEGKPITLAARRRIANPRNLDLSDDSDLDFINEANGGIAGYEDEDDDLYYDDGIIDDHPIYQSPPPGDSQTKEASPVSNTPAMKEIDTAQPDVYSNGQYVSPEIKPDPRISMATTQNITSSGGAMIPEDGSNASVENTPVQSFPPFLNPVGGGLGYTQQSPQFYTPNPSVLNGYSLNSLTYTLQQYQQQQSQLEGYDSESDVPEFGAPPSGYYSGVEDFEDGMDDDDIVAAANAEALANDADGFYGQEFGMFQHGQFANGNTVNQPGALRPPALTPISERSESSYRNSLVFPNQWSNGALSPQGLLSTSLGNNEGGEGELSLEGLMRYRRSAWGGSNVSLPSSGASVDGSAGTSPVENRLPGLPSLTTTGFENTSPAMMQPLSPPLSSPPGIPSPLGLGSPPGLGMPLGLGAPPGLSHPARNTPPPPGLIHAGGNAMLPTKGSFDETMLAGMGMGMKAPSTRVPEKVEEEDAGYASGRPSTETVGGLSPVKI